MAVTEGSMDMTRQTEIQRFLENSGDRRYDGGCSSGVWPEGWWPTIVSLFQDLQIPKVVKATSHEHHSQYSIRKGASWTTITVVSDCGFTVCPGILAG
nr:hypothetical protein [Tanacetum cinerariifolium]